MFLKYNYFKLSSIVLIELLGLFIYLLIDSVLDKYKVSFLLELKKPILIIPNINENITNRNTFNFLLLIY